MASEPHPPASPASTRDALLAAMDAIGLNIATGFGRARGFGHAPMPPGIGAAPAWGDPEPAFADSMKRHLDNVNRQLVTTGNAVDHLDETLTQAIDAHLSAIGLDDLTHNPNHNQKTN